MLSLVVALGVLGLQSAAEPDLPVSLDRIRARLAAPATLQIALPEPAADYRVFIHEHPYWTDEPLDSRFKVPPISALTAPTTPGSPESFIVQHIAPGGGVDLPSPVAQIRHAIQSRRARKEVERAIAEFCAANSCR